MADSRVKPFMYGIRCPDGTAYMDEICVDLDAGTLEDLIEEYSMDGYEVVPLYLNVTTPTSDMRDAEGQTIQAAQITMGLGLVDVTRIEHVGRSGILFRPRDRHIPVGDAGELPSGEYWPGEGDVVIWIENEGGAEVIKNYLSPFLTPTPVPDADAHKRGVEAALDELEQVPLVNLVKTDLTEVKAAWQVAARAQRMADLSWLRAYLEASGAVLCAEPVAHIVTDPKGRRRVTLSTQYDPMASAFWVGGERPEGYSVTPLYTRSPSTPEGE